MTLNDFDLSLLSVRELQTESARALAYYLETNTSLAAINKQSHHDSHQFYKVVIQKYIDEFGNLPSKIGPGSKIELVLEKNINKGIDPKE